MVDIQEWPIPENPIPEGRICISFTIPDDVVYRQVMLDWMNQLCYQYNWQRDTAKSAVAVSNLFKQSRMEMIQSLTEGCTGDEMYFRMRINPDDGCTSEAQYEIGGDWIPFMMQCCCDGQSTQEILRRVNPTTNQLEISTDGGATWIPDPESPIVTSVTAWPAPIPSGVSADKCHAAANGKEHIEDLIAGCSEWLETAGTVLELAVGVCTALLTLITALSAGTVAPAAAALATAIWAAAAGALEIGKTAFDGYWTDPERDKILCALFCTIGDDGAFTDAQYGAFLQKWQSLAIPSPALNLVLSSVKAGGRVGLNNLCSYGVPAEPDCDSCECGCADSFVVWNGCGANFETGSDENGDYVQADAILDVPNFGGYVAAFTTNDMNDCCTMVIYEGVPSNGSGTWFYDLCGEPITSLGSVFPHSGLQPTQEVNTVGHNGTIPFTLRLYFG